MSQPKHPGAFYQYRDGASEEIRRKRGRENDAKHRAEHPYGCASGGKCLICIPIPLPPRRE